jgi:hypothetical protein
MKLAPPRDWGREYGLRVFDWTATRLPYTTETTWERWLLLRKVDGPTVPATTGPRVAQMSASRSWSHRGHARDDRTGFAQTKVRWDLTGARSGTERTGTGTSHFACWPTLSSPCLALPKQRRRSARNARQRLGGAIPAAPPRTPRWSAVLLERDTGEQPLLSFSRLGSHTWGCPCN